ncbi:transglycosylase family protein [Flexivirga sp. ID2601S]|uniref:Transglycosylase family protein n=2 Tax=Flexivirga aerilata TaxID=1656889 RepID=A0A849AGZ4_9MICO|nr:transglycosylase family protein [Flexivirga aerilata]
MQLKPQTSSTAAPSSSSAAPKPSTTSATPKKTAAKTTTRATAGGVSRDHARATLTPRAAAPKATPKTVTPKKVTPNRVAPATKAPVQTPRTTPKPTSASNAGLDLSRAGMWDRIAMCESTGNWHINTGNGYYGGLQFDLGTWLGAGGGKFASRADLATREQQITIANTVFASRGLSPWQCASAA